MSLFNEDLPFNEVGPSEDDDLEQSIDYEDPAKKEEKMNWSTPNYNNSGVSYTNPWDPQPSQQTPTNNNPFYQGGSFYQPRPLFSQTNNQQTATISLPRGRRIIVCDFLDNIVENWSSAAGVAPRGIYDLKPKFDLWYKLKHINPEYVIVCTNQDLSARNEEDYSSTINYYMRSLSQFIDIPRECCIFSGKVSFDKNDYFVKPNPGLLIRALESIGLQDIQKIKNDILIVGYNSGLPGSSNIDAEMARNLNIEYIDIPQLLNKYV